MDVLLRDELVETALGENGVGDVATRVLPRLRSVQPKLVQHPVVRPVGKLSCSKLESTERVGDVLQRVHDAMRVIIRRIHTPCVLGAGMGVVKHTVCGEVPHVGVVARQLTSHTQHRLSLGVATRRHLVELDQVLLHAPISPPRRRSLRKRKVTRRVHKRFQFALRCCVSLGGSLDKRPRLLQRNSLALHVLGGEIGTKSLGELELVAGGGRIFLGVVAHVRSTHLDELDRQVMKGLEVVRGICDLQRCVPQELDSAEDGVDVLLLLRSGVGVIEAHDTVAALAFGESKVETHGLGVADMEVAVGLWREPGPPFATRGLEMCGEQFRRIAGERETGSSRVRVLARVLQNLDRILLFRRLLFGRGSRSRWFGGLRGRVFGPLRLGRHRT
mmetsp:Transcript_53867/g.127167  ORF Transcript_53867/g.127167 Transcript_53867/m.127167 type:complete len:388 (-) Transcript_53867:217-1380(-)